MGQLGDQPAELGFDSKRGKRLGGVSAVTTPAQRLLVCLPGGDEPLVRPAAAGMGVGHGHAEAPELGLGVCPLAFMLSFPAVQVLLGGLAGGADGTAAAAVPGSAEIGCARRQPVVALSWRVPGRWR